MDVALVTGAASIVASDKLGSNLVVTFSDGTTLRVDDFFVIGENGDFSRLLLPSGDPFVTGLMGPEPAYPDGATERMAQASGAEDAAGDDGDADQDGLVGQSVDWSDPLLLAGAGISLGSGVDFLSGGGSSTAPETGREEEDDLAQVIDDFTGGESGVLDPSEYDMDTQDVDVDAEAAAEDMAGEAIGSDDFTVEGTFVGASETADVLQNAESDAPHDLLNELLTEF
ncbi:hypothetical protein BOO69_02630 [Sulfitobacter alexandrii]|uniref:Uncharacterized protein n=2 Tax=Sulfitobacter alexandrii TaxID=1917485 RepID=A0A1J0WDN9_9RHOB|nr:hypothetical protein BOO69_02630 [Sulfitobacter alexandrii]